MYSMSSRQRCSLASLSSLMDSQTPDSVSSSNASLPDAVGDEWSDEELEYAPFPWVRFDDDDNNYENEINTTRQSGEHNQKGYDDDDDDNDDVNDDDDDFIQSECLGYVR